MVRPARRGLGLIGALVIAGLWSGAVASGAGGTGPPQVTVRPTIGSPRTDFVVSFTAQRTGYVGSTRRVYVVAVSDGSIPPGTRRCASTDHVALPATVLGQRVHAKLVPAGSLHAWCRGIYSGRLEEFIVPVCPFREVCPFDRVARAGFSELIEVGRFRFRVR